MRPSEANERRVTDALALVSEPPFCGLCGEPMGPWEVSQAVRDAAGYDICCQCLEDMTCDASTLNA